MIQNNKRILYNFGPFRSLNDGFLVVCCVLNSQTIPVPPSLGGRVGRPGPGTRCPPGDRQNPNQIRIHTRDACEHNTVRIQPEPSMKWTGFENKPYLRSCQANACFPLNPRWPTGSTFTLPSKRQMHLESENR